MRRTSTISLPAGFLVCLLCLTSFSAAQSGPRDRILHAISDSQLTTLRGNMHPLARPQFDQGEVSPGLQMHGISMMFQLSASQQADLAQFLAELHDPASPNYHKWITPGQYAARFGMSQDDLNRVTSWLQSQGFTGIHIAPTHQRISFDGTAARVEAAFHTQIHNFQESGETHFANASEPSLPSAFAGTVLAFSHLDNFRPKPRLRHPNPRFTSSQTGNHFLSPGDFATIYDLKPLYNAGLDGTGVTIAVIGQTFINVARANNFRSLSGLPANPPQLFLTPLTGASAMRSGDVDEANLDVEWAGGVAPGATILFDYAGTNGSVFDAFTDALENDRAPIVSISYGNCESMIGTPASVQSLRSLVQTGNTFGQTVTAASGDDGAADCDGNDALPPTTASQGLSVDVPAAIPEVMGIGGSEFTGDAAGVVTGTPPNSNAGATTYWGGTAGSADNLSSALMYIPEMAWNDTSNVNQLSASGGGLSTLFSKPSWQNALTPADGVRDVPDISLNGSNFHDSYLVCSELDGGGLQSCTNGFRDSSGGLDAFGGTSVGAQAFAGILAIINQATNSPLGNANMELYNLAGTTPSGFHDITTGNNIVPCQQGSTNCPASAPFQYGYSAGAGYDRVTGLGSPEANNLIRAWPGFSSSPAQSYSLSATSTNVSSPGTSGTASIAVLPGTTGFAGTVTLTCAVPMNLGNLEMGCSFTAPTSGASTSVNINQTATLSVTTTAPHAIAATSAKAQAGGRLGWFAASAGALFAGFFAMGVPSRRRRWSAMLGLIFCVFLAVGVGCGGGSSSTGGGGGGGQTDPGTPIGTYNITVTGTSGNITKTANVLVSVQ